MAKGKTRLAAGTAIVVAPAAPRAVIINAERDPNPDNPHTWFPLLGDPPGSSGDRILWGVMRRSYRDHINSAHAMMAAKLRPAWSPDDRALTAVRHDMLAPADADDSFADPWLLAARIDREIACGRTAARRCSPMPRSRLPRSGRSIISTKKCA